MFSPVIYISREPKTKASFVFTKSLTNDFFSNFRYSLQNCLFAATYDKILEECKCVPYFHTIAYSDYPVICAGEGLYCMNNVLRDIGSHTEITNYEAPEESQAANRTNDEGK